MQEQYSLGREGEWTHKPSPEKQMDMSHILEWEEKALREELFVYNSGSERTWGETS